MTDQWILTTVTFLPLLGAMGLLFFNKESKQGIAWYATAVAFVDMVISFPLFWRYNPSGAAFKFFLYTLLGSVLMLLGILALYFYHGSITGNYTFDVVTLMNMGRETSPAWLELSKWVFLAFFVGFAIKVPMFPFHTWLPDAHVEAPTAASVILAGVLLKMGTYGFVRFSLPILPYATRHYL